MSTTVLTRISSTLLALVFLLCFVTLANADMGSSPGPEGIRLFVQEAWAALKTMPPFIYFTVMALLCIFPVPISPFYVAAGPLFGFAPSLAWIGPAIAFNQLIAHWLTSGILRPPLERFLDRRGHVIPKPRSPGEESLLTALIRMTPGIPYALQNWILGLAGVERQRYLMISWPIQMLHASAWVLLGQSMFEGRTGVIAIAIVLIVGLGLIARWASSRLRRSRDEE